MLTVTVDDTASDGLFDALALAVAVAATLAVCVALCEALPLAEGNALVLTESVVDNVADKLGDSARVDDSDGDSE